MRLHEKKIIYPVIGLLLLFCAAFVLRLLAFQSSPLTNDMTLEELEGISLKIGYVQTEDGWHEQWHGASSVSYVDSELAGAKESPCILRVTPTGNLYFNSGLILQEVQVEEVIKGECSYHVIWLTNGLWSTLEDRGDDVLLIGMERSFMQEGCEYLLFCEPSATNAYSEKKVYTETDSMWSGCYNISRSCDTLVAETEPDYDPAIDYYTSSGEVLSDYEEARQALIETYCKEE